ncbi:hypothetical protein Jab_1c08510 [Janthinobacterium sp. HH01]|uniref:hypothetical protein n=1 Tax=Janthinobacterium sp. HH01 TaxID=1198452 RepID=UPI0002AEA9A0|nr:hypothetical protein [Janthinobacterium sp. HH01]ELX12257.1 hypothetical protein Jab_1c08510 [Janthinobacterium sp. HH01]
MKKHVYAGILAITLAFPAFAAPTTLQPSAPDQPLRSRAVLSCMLLLVGLHAYSRRFQKQRRHGLQMIAAD